MNHVVGISDVGVYLPDSYLTLDDIVDSRRGLSAVLRKKLLKAAEITGQKGIRFPRLWEDTATMGAQAVLDLFDRTGTACCGHLRHIAVGTETTLDHSKPVSAYIQGMLRKSGVPIPRNLSSFQTQHACAGGTVALMSVAGMMALNPDPDEKGLVICSDIAQYDKNTTAEITQGSGSIVLLIEKNPKLAEIFTTYVGLYSSDEDDFFRPLDSKTAQVKGRYSMKCYQDAFIESFADFCRRSGQREADVLHNTDYFLLHTPFKHMPEMALRFLAETFLELNESETRGFLEEKVLNDSVEPVSCIGNLYSGALYLSFVYLLERQFRKIGRQIIGKKFLFASYGSGNTMIILSGRILPSAPDVIRRWNFEAKLIASSNAPVDDYDAWTDSPVFLRPGLSFPADAAPEGRFYIESIREDGYRVYGYRGKT